MTFFKMKHAISIFSVVLTSISTLALADVGLEYEYDSHFKVIGVNGLVGIEDPLTDPIEACSQRIATVVVDSVVYETNSQKITGFKAKIPAPMKSNMLINLDSDQIYKSLAKKAQPDVSKLIRKGADLIVTYQTCGSSGYASATNIFKKSALNR